MGSALLDAIRKANQEFQDFIGQASESGGKVVVSRGAARRLQRINQRIQQVGRVFSARSPAAEWTAQELQQVVKYRDNLKSLRTVMETLQFSLEAEKARLENVRANMQAACAWAASVREIS